MKIGTHSSLSNLSKWSAACEKETQSAAPVDESARYANLLDTFNRDVDRITKQDGSPCDLEPAPGEVKLVNRQSGEIAILQKQSKENFKMFTVSPGETGEPPKLMAYHTDLKSNTIACLEYDNACGSQLVQDERDRSVGQVDHTILGLTKEKVIAHSTIDTNLASAMYFDSDDVIQLLRRDLGKREPWQY